MWMRPRMRAGSRPANLAKYKVVIFLSTSGDILNEEQQAAFKNFIEQGGGLAAIHAAVAGDVATEGNWPWYGEALCARFTNHSAIVQATVNVEDRKHPSTAPLPEHWVRTDEWYNFMASPRGQARVLASLDETTYQGRHDGQGPSDCVVQAGRQRAVSGTPRWDTPKRASRNRCSSSTCWAASRRPRAPRRTDLSGGEANRLLSYMAEPGRP